MIPKGQVKISIKKSTDIRLNEVLKTMIKESPEKYDEKTPYNSIITWLIDRAKGNH